MEPGWRKSAMAVFPLYSRLMLVRQKIFVGVIPGRVRSTRARNLYPKRRGYGSGLAASDLGFTRNRHYKMRTSATADVRWRPGTTSDAVGLERSRRCISTQTRSRLAD